MPSEKILEQKKQLVADLAADLKESCTGVIVNYKGINVADDTKLRKQLREAGSTYKVVKNTMLKRALDEAGIERPGRRARGHHGYCLQQRGLCCQRRSARLFAEKSKTFELKAGFVDGNALDAAGVKELAALPPKEVLVAKALGGLNAPITGFVTVLNGTLKGLVVALNAIAEKQGAQA